MNTIDDWRVAFRTASPWVVVTAVVMIPCAFFLEDPWSNNPLDMLLIIAVVAVPLLLPFVTGMRHRSGKVGVATAVLGITIGGVVFTVILVLSFGGGVGPYF